MPAQPGSPSESLIRGRVPQKIAYPTERAAHAAIESQLVSDNFHVAAHFTSALETARMRSDCIIPAVLGL